ncbi:MAG: ABC transporter substrate-binding protein, partial [Candidatus Methanomethylicia archaeon]
MRITIAIIAMLLILTCITPFIQAQKIPVTFTLGWVGVIKFNPFAGYAYGIYRSALYGTLFRYDENLNPVPWVAEKYERIDPTTVIVYLRKDVKWHDGKPFTAEDVKFTFDLILKYKGAMSRFMTGVKEA